MIPKAEWFPKLSGWSCVLCPHLLRGLIHPVAPLTLRRVLVSDASILRPKDCKIDSFQMIAGGNIWFIFVLWLHKIFGPDNKLKKLLTIQDQNRCVPTFAFRTTAFSLTRPSPRKCRPLIPPPTKFLLRLPNLFSLTIFHAHTPLSFFGLTLSHFMVQLFLSPLRMSYNSFSVS
jgi:hypothetical protein